MACRCIQRIRRPRNGSQTDRNSLRRLKLSARLAYKAEVLLLFAITYYARFLLDMAFQWVGGCKQRRELDVVVVNVEINSARFCSVKPLFLTKILLDVNTNLD